MRNSIIYLLLFISFNLVAFQPPQPPSQPQKMQILLEELSQEAKNRQSYLSLLPREITGMVTQYAYAEMPEVIAALRQKYLADPATRDKFLNDEAFNRKIINDLIKRFDKTENWKFDIALMLNTPASIRQAFEPRELTFNRFSKEKLHRFFTNLFYVLWNYLLKMSLSYKEAITYALNYINNIEAISVEILPGRYYERATYHMDSEDEMKQLIADTILKIGKKYKKDLQGGYPVPEIKIALDLGSWEARKWLTDIFDGTRKIPVSALEICNQSASLLQTALEQNDQDHIIFMLNSIFLSQNTEQILQLCLSQKMQGTLGDLLIAYVLQREKKQLEKVRFPTLFSSVLVKKAIKQNFTSDQLLKLLRKLNVDLEIKHITPVSFGQSWEDFLLSGERASIGLHDFQAARTQAIKRNSKIRAVGIDLLITTIEALQEMMPVVKKLIELGVDVNGADQEGVTVLMHAIKNARFDIAHFLLDQRTININACDSNGHNALSFAELLPANQERDALIKRLRDMGAEEEGVCAIQ